MQGTAAHLLLDELLSKWRGVIGADYDGYRNHAQRMITFCFAIRPCTPEEQEKIAIAACFHDIGIWTAKTFDYLDPSAQLASDYLKSRGMERWSDEVVLMITEHHVLRAIRDPRYPLVEAFRKGDLVDLSLGIVKCGLPRSLVREVKKRYPNASFHWTLVRKALAWFVRHPLNPAPMMKW